MPRLGRTGTVVEGVGSNVVDQGLVDAKLSFLRNTSVCEFERGDGGWRMLSWDQVPHLAQPEHESLHSHY